MLLERGKLLQAIHYLSDEDIKIVRHAVLCAEKWHEGQQRASGEPYVIHPLSVAAYLAALEADTSTIVAALLHDVVEDEQATAEEVKKEFGEEVTMLVEGVTKLSKLEYDGRRSDRQLASLRKMLLTASSDLRVIFIKLADRWHNIETIDALDEAKRKRVALETLDIYVPFARLIGLWDLKTQFENTCFPIAHPDVSFLWKKTIRETMDPLETERQNFTEKINGDTAGDVEARLVRMTDFEIFAKLQGNMERLKETGNIDSILILLKNENAMPIDCYQMLGEIHQHYPVRIGSFRDYISAPKPTGYRALHTNIFLSRNHEVQLRIQTQKMYEYVAQRKLSSWMEKQQKDIYEALSSLNTPAYDPSQFMSDLKDTVLMERMNIFTSSGEIVALPKGATGIDFAFALNPDHLAYLESVRVNGELREATFTLHDGDIVDLVLLNNGIGKRKSLWLEKTKSVEARESLKDSLKRRTKQKRNEEGMELLVAELRKRRLPVWALANIAKLQQQLSDVMNVENFDALITKIGSGEMAISSVLSSYQNILSQKRQPYTFIMKIFGLLPRTRVLSKDSIVIDIEVYAQDRPGLIYEITRCFAERDINIAKFGVFAIPPKEALYSIRLEVIDFETFSDLYDAIIQVPGVRQVLRRK